MKDKNMLADIETKSLEELNNIANKLIDNLEKKSLEDFIKDYQELIKLNNFIEKKFHQETRSIKCKELQARFHKVPIFSTLIGLLGIKDLIFLNQSIFLLDIFT